MSLHLHVLDFGSVKFPKEVSVLGLVEHSFPQKKQQLAGAFINGSKEISDVRTLLKHKDKVKLVFIPSKEALPVIRHSGAHVMAQAVQELWPNDIQVTIGPVIENGFYYDFGSSRVFQPEDLRLIEKRMKEIIKKKLEVTKEIWTKEKAISVFKEMGEMYKVEIIKDLNEEQVSIYRQGDWFDLCRGPHVKNLSQIGAIKILHQSAAYWRGDEKKASLQRIYGTAFHSKEELEQHLHDLEEAGKRDHRKLGRQMNLFHFSDLSPGSPFFTGAGAFIYNELKDFLKQMYKKYSYEEVITPQIFSGELFDRSGHKQYFLDNMYPVSVDQREFFLKPMNCPSHCLLYSFKKFSYRNLPWRIADFGRLHRKERKGTLHGITRVTSLCQDDAHIFCTQDQLKAEMKNILHMFTEVYETLGLTDYKLGFSTRPENAMGERNVWEKAEQSLRFVLEESKIPFEVYEGEGAFYGPKLDVIFVDSMRRNWQLGTLQCDFNMPLAFGLKYVDKDNREKTPILLHRAILGSLERFMGVYLEHREGYLPFWLSPVQALLINISKDQESYVKELEEQMKSSGIRVESDLRGEKLGYKIREARLRKIPCMVIVGAKEMKSGVLALRLQGKKDVELSKDSFIERMKMMIQSKNPNLLLE